MVSTVTALLVTSKVLLQYLGDLLNTDNRDQVRRILAYGNHHHAVVLIFMIKQMLYEIT
jgi:hypothetical protein